MADATPSSTNLSASAMAEFGFSDTSAAFNAEMMCQLKIRLRAAAWILTVGSSAFLVRNVLVGAYDPHPMWMWVHLGAILLGALPLVPLHRQCEYTTWKLRAMEGLVFVAPAIAFAWKQVHTACHCNPDELASFVASYTAETSIRWIVLVQLYSLYVPVATQWTTTKIVILSVVPLVASVIAGAEQPMLAAKLYGEGHLSAMALWMAIGATIAIYRTLRLAALKREVYDARQLGSYSLRERIGSGGMGEVFRAEHALLKRPAAIKLVRGDRVGEAGALARFEEEVQAAARLTHPNTIEIYDYGHTPDGTFYYVMEYLPGLSLQEIVERFGPMPPERAVHLVRQILLALREAHLLGMVHRDVKPSNVLVTERGGLYDVAKLLDFGLVKTAEHSDTKLTMDGAIVGSPLYAPPEATTDQPLDARSDLYSLGATAFFLLAGRPVFEGTNPLKVMFAHVNEDPPSLLDVAPDVPVALASLVDRCLRKEPDERFADADELLEALEACQCDDRWSKDRAADWWETHTVRPTESTFQPHEQTLLVDSTQ